MARAKLIPADTRATMRTRKPCSSFNNRRIRIPATGASSMHERTGNDAMCSVISETHQEIDAKARQDQDHEQQVVLQESGLQERQDTAASRQGEGYGVYAAVHHPPVIVGEPLGKEGVNHG